MESSKASSPTLLAWLELAVTHISAPEIAVIACNIAAYVLGDAFPGNFYLWIVIAACDTIIVFAHGAYLEAKPNTEKGPWYTPTPIVLRLSTTVALFIVSAEGNNSAIVIYAWYVLTMAAICHAFFCVLLTLHATDESWLANTNGRVGTPNWFSIGRMALSVLVPHIFVARPFGAISGIVATIIMGVAIMTDAADGYLARKLGQTTKAGKALDPLGDKIIFYPMVVAYILATNSTLYAPGIINQSIFYVCIAITFARDAIFFIWFVRNYAKLPTGSGASIVDKIRMATICVWLGTATLSLAAPVIHKRLARANYIVMIIIAAMSLVSTVYDTRRIRALTQASDSRRNK